jgi:hypothetical protein
MPPKLRFPPLILAAALLALPVSASASTKSENATLTAAGQTVTLTPKCPHGQRATGGGFLSPPPGGTLAIVYESRKIGQRRWRVSTEEGGGPGVLPVTAFVYCSAGAPRTKEKSTAVAVPNVPAFASAAASCGNAGKAQAGGFSSSVPVPGFAFAGIIDSFRVSKKTWRTRAFNTGGVPEPTLTSYAYCADVGSPKARSGSGVTSSTHLEPKTALSGKCKHGTHVEAGGFSQPDATLTPTVDLYQFPWESLRVGKRWQHSAQHFGTLSTTLTSIAYCG